MDKKKLSKKQEPVPKKKKQIRLIDSNNLRSIIEKKYQWALAEKTKDINLINKLQIQIARLDGIILFCKDLIDPQEEK